MKNKLKGKFIVLDGPDGCGKSTQLKLLAEYLKEQGFDVVTTHDPGGTKIGDQIRRLLKYDAQGQMEVHTELMLFMASRAQLVAEVIRPALAGDRVVLCDRFISSTCAYQGGSGFPVKQIVEIGKFAVGDIWPDLTIIIDIPVEQGLKRTGRVPGQKTRTKHNYANHGHLFENAVVDRFDSRSLSYHRKVRKEFLRLPEYYPGAVKTIDSRECNIEAVNKKVIQIIEQTQF